MILPSKHINFSESILGFGSYLLTKLQTPLTVDELWKTYQSDFNNHRFFGRQNFDTLILTLIFLFSINAIEENKGLLKKCS